MSICQYLTCKSFLCPPKANNWNCASVSASASIHSHFSTCPGLGGLGVGNADVMAYIGARMVGIDGGGDMDRRRGYGIIFEMGLVQRGG